MKKIWELWKRTAEAIGNLQFSILFSILYFLIVTPIGLVASIFRDNLSNQHPPEWKEVKDNTSYLERMKKQ